MLLKKGLLILSFATICIIALMYGVSPHWFFETMLVDASAPSTDQTHILRAVMTLYTGFGLFWLYCAFSDRYRDAGIIVIAVLCGGLVVGRVLSILIDGVPSPVLLVYTGMELALVPICIWVLKRD